MTGSVRVDVGRCKDCRHWIDEFGGAAQRAANFKSWTDQFPVELRATKRDHTEGTRNCARIQNGEDRVAILESHRGEVLTGPEFGCVLWEAKT